MKRCYPETIGSFKPLLLGAIIIGAFLFGYACGSDEQTSEEKDQQRQEDNEYYANLLVDKEDEPYVEIPKCTVTKEEKLIYVPAEEVFIVCRKGMWNYLLQETKKECPIAQGNEENAE